MDQEVLSPRSSSHQLGGPRLEDLSTGEPKMPLGSRALRAPQSCPQQRHEWSCPEPPSE